MDGNVGLVAEVVAAYVSRNAIAPHDLPRLIADVANAFRNLDQPSPLVEPASKPVPVVPIRKSVTPDYIVCLEDGKKLKTMKRHLRTAYGMSPEEYRAKWGLPSDYPMVAPNYAEARSEMAKSIGLGRKGKARQRAA